MASSEQAKRDKVAGKVPKMATHFETLAEKSKDEPTTTTTAAAPSLEEISKLRGAAQQNSADAIRSAEQRYQKAKHRPQTTETHQQTQAPKGYNYTSAAVEKSTQAKDYAAQKAVEAKDALAGKGQTAAQVAAEKADVTLEGGKGAAGYVGKVASGVKDQAVVATHYTMEKVAGATKTVADVTSSVGQTVGGYAAEKLAAAKDVVVESEEKAADYAARKQEEARKRMEAEGGGSIVSKDKAEVEEQWEMPSDKFEESYFRGDEEYDETKPKQEAGKFEESYFRGDEEYEQKPKQQAGSVFQAIGETIVGIGQTTKDILIGQSPEKDGSERK